jgi:heme exporter protein A
MSNHHLQVKQLACIRGDRHLFSGLDIDLSSGQLLYLQGRNGSGKTTLLRTLCGLFHPDEGEVLWSGKRMAEMGESFYQQVLYIGHAPGIKLDLTPVENLRVYSRLHGLGADEQALWQALQTLGLKGFEDLPARMLSAGQKRRIALARLFIDRAALWILDEPFTALDVAAVELLQSLIVGHVDRGGMVILTTHQEVKLPDHQVQRLRLGE